MIFSNELLSVECQNPVNWNFLLENPQDPSPNKITCDLPPRPVSALETFKKKKENKIFVEFTVYCIV